MKEIIVLYGNTNMGTTTLQKILNSKGVMYVVIRDEIEMIKNNIGIMPTMVVGTKAYLFPEAVEYLMKEGLLK